MSIQDKFWKKPTAPLEHVANMEAEHKPNTLSMCLFTSAKHLTRWVWDPPWVGNPLRLQSPLTSESGSTFCFAQSQKSKEHYGKGETVSHPNPCIPHTVARHSLVLYVHWQESVSFGPKPAACRAFQGTGKQYSLTVSLHSLAVQGLQGKSRDVLQELDLNSKQ